MSRFVYVIILCLPFILYFLWRVPFMERHELRYDEQDRYRFARRMISIMKHNGRIKPMPTVWKIYPLKVATSCMLTIRVNTTPWALSVFTTPPVPS